MAQNLFLKLRLDFSLTALVFLCLLFLSYPFFYGFPLKLISWDTLGYYAYLPQLFNEGDIAISDLSALKEAVTLYDASKNFYQFHTLANGNNIIQYNCGISLLSLPFYSVGHASALIGGYKTDGYSLPYAISFLIGSYFFMIAGLILFRKVLLQYFTKNLSGWILLIICLSTNYLSINALSHGSPHVYLFPFYCGLVLTSIRWNKYKRDRDIYLIAIIVALMVLVRSLEIISILIPLFWGISNWKAFRVRLLELKNKRRVVIKAFIIASLICSIQMIYWVFVAGKPLLSGYVTAGEGLYLDEPNLFQFLFSFRKGWFIYTPMMLLIVVGLFVKTKHNKDWIMPVVIFFLVNLYFSSSWSTWWYATSFSQRTMVHSYVIMAFPLGILLTYLKGSPPKQILGGLLILLFTALNIFQTFQYKIGTLDASRMTREYYLATFGKLNGVPGAGELLLIDRQNTSFSPEKVQLTRELSTGPEPTILSAENEWAEAIEAPYFTTSKDYYAWYEIEVDIFVPEYTSVDKINITANFKQGERHYGDQYFNLANENDFMKENWYHWRVIYLSPDIRRPTDIFQAYVWATKEDVTYKNLTVSAYEPN